MRIPQAGNQLEQGYPVIGIIINVVESCATIQRQRRVGGDCSRYLSKRCIKISNYNMHKQTF